MSRRIPILWLLLWLVLGSFAGACVDSAALGSDCEVDGGCSVHEAGGAGGAVSLTLPFEPESLSGITSLDLLFVIDDSPGMAVHQAALAARVPALIDQLLRGELDGGGFPEFHPLREVRAAVIAANRGVGVTLGSGCNSLPRGTLTTENAAAECMGRHSAFMRFGASDAGPVGAELACAVQLGGNTCGVSQPLEAMLEGLTEWNTVLSGNWAEDSAQLVIVLSDNEDCSSVDEALFAPDDQLMAGDPLRGQPDALRCTANPNRLDDLSRFSQGLQRLRPGQADRILFLPIAGFPAALASPEAYSGYAFANDGERSLFYMDLFGDSHMAYGMTLGATGRVGNACADGMVAATPGQRLAKLAQALGTGARVGSVCAEVEEPLSAVRQLVASRVGLAGL